MSEFTQEIKDDQDRAVDELSIGMTFAAKKIKRYYDILVAVGLSEEIIKVEMDAYCQGESRLQIENMLHYMFAQPRGGQESRPDAA